MCMVLGINLVQADIVVFSAIACFNRDDQVTKSQNVDDIANRSNSSSEQILCKRKQMKRGIPILKFAWSSFTEYSYISRNVFYRLNVGSNIFDVFQAYAGPLIFQKPRREHNHRKVCAGFFSKQFAGVRPVRREVDQRPQHSRWYPTIVLSS